MDPTPSPFQPEPPTPLLPTGAAPSLSAGPVEPVPAEFWIRLGAFSIDSALVGLVSVLMTPLPDLPKMVLRLALGVAYMTILPMKMAGQTPGKRAGGIAIARDDGRPLAYGNTFARSLGYWVSDLTLGLGYLCALATPRKRALHDYIGGTRVVRVEEASTARRTLVIMAGIVFSLIIAIAAAATFAHLLSDVP